MRAKLLWHARNFGSVAAIRTGLVHAEGDFVAVMAADLQEPEELIVDFHNALRSGDYDVAVGVRRRQEPRLELRRGG